jgi:hypothetical protein
MIDHRYVFKYKAAYRCPKAPDRVCSSLGYYTRDDMTIYFVCRTCGEHFEPANLPKTFFL